MDYKIFFIHVSLLISLILFQNCSGEFASVQDDFVAIHSTSPDEIEPTPIEEPETPPAITPEEPTVPEKPPIVVEPVKPIEEVNPERKVVLNDTGIELSGSTHTFTFSDSEAVNGLTRYDIWLGDKDLTTSVAAPATSITARGLPTDGKEHFITLRPPAGYTDDEFEPITVKFKAATIEGEVFPLNFGTKAIPFGSLTSVDLEKWTSGLQSSRERNYMSVVLENGKGVLRHKYVPTSTGSHKLVYRYDIPHQRTYRLKYSVFFEKGFEWGQRYQGGKLAFGFGGGAKPSGGQVNPAGFTARVMWRGNHLGGGKFDGTARFVMYTYNADRDLSKSTVGLDTQFGNYHVPIGAWIDVVFEIEMNTKTSLADGSMRGWINGNLLVEKKNMKWWSKGDKPRIDTLYYSSFYGGSNPQWSPTKPTYVRVKDVAYAPVINGESAIQP